jgi:Do/DeqQ family serine protease
MKSRLLPVVLTAALTSLGTFFLAARYGGASNPLLGATTKQLPVNYVGMGDKPIVSATAPVDFQAAAEASVKAVVHITTTTPARTVVANDPWDDFFGGMFGQRQYTLPPQMGSGSGVVVSPDGYIVTNNHVVAGAEQMTVTFNDRYTTSAKVVSTDPSTDLAVIKVEEKNLPYMEFGNSDDVRLGQWVLAVGYPFSLDATVTAGIVSAKGRSIGINRQQSTSAIESFIQTDAAVNPGNSGGALVNTQGQLVGINSAIASPSGTYTGYAYAIPANIVRKVVGDLKQYGKVQRGYLGIQYLDRKQATPEQLTALGLDRNDGVYVQDVTEGGGAKAAGLRRGDFITQVGGMAVHTEPELLEQIARYKPGDHIAISYKRGGADYNATVELKNSAGTTGIVRDGSGTKLLGATIRPLTSDEKRNYSAYYGISGGVMVTDPGSGAIGHTRPAIKKSFVITAINDQEVKTVEDLQRAMAAAGYPIQLRGIYPGYNGNYYYSITEPGGNSEQ